MISLSEERIIDLLNEYIASGVENRLVFGAKVAQDQLKEVVEQIGDCFDELAGIANILKDSNKSNALAVDALFNINRRWRALLQEVKKGGN